ncbi:hypothetical protein [Gilvimarinus japonicus]|uniref:Uncharacterized protein n=1 Tax=Gilvimarinus japonicus TaxID=1796469 RepID=A0ABV7HTL1_9GAMM
MRVSALVLLGLLQGLLLSGCASAHEISLVGGQEYVVPDEKLWVIKNTPVASCRVCTADVYIKGELSNVEIAGVIFHGEFDFSVSAEHHGAIKIYPGTRVWLGDTRRELLVNEEALP